MDSRSPAPSFLVLAGEASADTLGALLVEEIRTLLPQASFFGVGGARCSRVGVETLFDARELSITGLEGWWGKLSQVWQIQKRLYQECILRQPLGAILIDLPDFNLFLAGRLQHLKIPVFYYSSPQIWIWRKYRIRKIKRRVRRMMVFLPFEEELYRSRGVPVTFTGHPIADVLKAREVPRSPDLIQEQPRIALLPGSREKELQLLGPIFRETVERLLSLFPRAQFQVPIAPTLEPGKVKALFEGLPIQFATQGVESLQWCDTAVIFSGTASLEAALMGVPSVVLGKTTALTAFVLRHISRYPGFIALPNIVMGRQVFREILQEQITPAVIVEEVGKILRDAGYRDQIVSEVAACRERLKASPSVSASTVAAQAILSDLGMHRAPA